MREQLGTLKGNLAAFQELKDKTCESRELIAGNRQEDPFAAGYLISLFDQRLEILNEIIAAHNRVIEIISTLGADSPNPIAEIEKLMTGIANNVKVVSFLIKESMKISPGSKIRGEGLVQ